MRFAQIIFTSLALLGSAQGRSPSFVPKTSIDNLATAGAALPSKTNRLSDAATAPLSATATGSVHSTSSHAQQQLASVRGGGVSVDPNEITGSIAFIVLDHLFRVLFKTYKINFPSQLGGCCILFATMLLANVVVPGVGDSLFKILTPGAGGLARWLPVFFVPGLAMLPLAPSMGSFTEILKVLFVVIAGFYFSATTTSYAVLALRKMEGTAVTVAPPSPKAASDGPAAKPALPFSEDLLDTLTKGLVLTGALSIGAARVGNDLTTPLRTAFMCFSAFTGYVWGARLPSGFTKIVHPLVTSTIVTHVLTYLTALATGSTFNTVLATYKSGSMAWNKAGAGDILLYLLGPTVVSFAISMYSRKDVIAENLLVVCTAMLVASIGGLFGTAALVRILAVGGAAGEVLRKSLLPRNITTPLAIAITNILGGDISQAAAVVVLTGIYGATFGARFLTSLGITDPVSRGLGIGGSAQGLGVASISNEKEAFPFAAIGMVLTAVAATTFVSIPPIADALVKLATGQ